MRLGRFSTEQIHRARQTDLASYLMSVGVPLVKEGSRHRYRDDKKLVFTKNSFYWNGKNESGNAVDFLTSHMSEIGRANLSFRDALSELVGMAGAEKVVRAGCYDGSRGSMVSSNNCDATPKVFNTPAFSLDDVELSTEQSRVIAYLCKARKIDYSIVKELISEKLLFQEIVKFPCQKTGLDKEMYNALFPIYDGQEIVGAETIGTLTISRFKGIKPGSMYGYGYSVTKGDSIKYALFFESAVDLLSFMDIVKKKGKSLDDCVLVSLSGLKENIFIETIKRLGNSVVPVLCVDNDEAGDGFIKKAQAKFVNIRISRPEKLYKDWNEQLVAMKQP